jgi:general secretion pathway protein M
MSFRERLAGMNVRDRLGALNLRERLDALEERERRLLGILVLVFVGLVVVLVPVAVTAILSSKRSENEELRAAIEEIQASRETLRKRASERERVALRYSRPAPPLAGFLATIAKETAIEIPESQDRAVIPHGKRYEEKATKIVLRRVGMLNLVKFMERIEQSGHPVSISNLNIRKRGTELDSYDVEVIVSAFERKVETERPAQPTESAPTEEEQ